MITIYSQPSCVQCAATYRAMDKLGLDYQVVDLAEDASALAHVKELGFLQAPVVEAGEESWAGFRPDLIKAAAARIAAA